MPHLLKIKRTSFARSETKERWQFITEYLVKARLKCGKKIYLDFLSRLRARTNYIKKLIKNIIFMQVMIQTHQYMVDYLLLLQRLDG